MNDIAHNDLCIIYLMHFCTILHPNSVCKPHLCVCVRKCAYCRIVVESRLTAGHA